MMDSKSNFIVVLIAMVVGLVLSACGDEPTEENTDPEQETDTGTVNFDGSPVADLNTLVGNKYIIELKKSDWTKPNDPAVAGAIGDATPTFVFEIQTVDTTATPNTFTAMLGTVKNGAQDPCNKTYTMNGTFGTSDGVTDPGATTFTLAPKDIESIVEVDIPEQNHHAKASANLHNFTLSGNFVNQGDGFRYGRLFAEVDAREIYSLFYAFTANSGEDVCTQLPSVSSAACETCSFEAVDLCLIVGAELFKVPQTNNSLVLDTITTVDLNSCLALK